MQRIEACAYQCTLFEVYVTNIFKMYAPLIGFVRDISQSANQCSYKPQEQRTVAETGRNGLHLCLDTSLDSSQSKNVHFAWTLCPLLNNYELVNVWMWRCFGGKPVKLHTFHTWTPQWYRWRDACSSTYSAITYLHFGYSLQHLTLHGTVC
jgi:hypothetical protein